MSRPPKNNKKYTVKKAIVEDIKLYPEKYRDKFTVEEPLIKKIIYDPKTREEFLQKNKEAIKRLNDFKDNELLYTAWQLCSITGIRPDRIMKLIVDKEINPFQIKLNKEQISILHPFFNNILIYPISIEQFTKLLNGEHYKTLYPVKNIRELSAIFKALSDNNYICKNWQHLIEKFSLFTSKNGNPIKAIDLAKSIKNAKDFGGTTSESQYIADIIERLKKM